MDQFQYIRIAALLALIFTAGVATGRFTAPKPQVVVVGPGGTVRGTETALERFKSHIALTPSEEDKIRALLEELEPKIKQHEPHSPERLDALKQSIPQFKAILPPEKHAAFDRFV